MKNNIKDKVTLTNEEIEKINTLNEDLRVGPDPDNFDF